MNNKPIKRAIIALVAVGLILIASIAMHIVRIFTAPSEMNLFTVISSAIGTVIVFVVLIIALALLKSIKSEETPFNTKNVKYLKAIAGILMMFEPLMYILQWFQNTFYPIVLEDGMAMTIHTSIGGVVFAVGLIVYCVSLVLEYGVSLQQQIDETL